MASSTIDDSTDCVTVINVFTVEPDRADELLQLLSSATDESFSRMPGFISANFHMSLDRTRVTNYAQWRTEEDLRRAMFEDPAGIAERAGAGLVKTSSEGAVYRVASVHPPRAADR